MPKPLQLASQVVAHAAEPRLALCVPLLKDQRIAPHLPGALGADDYAELRAAPLPVGYLDGHSLDRERYLGYQYDVGAAGYAGVQGYPPGVAAHEFQHHRAVMAFRRRLQSDRPAGSGGDVHPQWVQNDVCAEHGPGRRVREIA